MFGFGLYDGNNYGDGARTLSFSERIDNWKATWHKARNERKGLVTPASSPDQFFRVNVAEVTRQNFQNEIFNTWECIYPKFRAQSMVSFLMPACAKFNSLSSVQAYINNNPTSRVAASLDIAKQICELKNNPNHQIILDSNTLAYWNSNAVLKNIILTVAPEFYSQVTNQLLENSYNLNTAERNVVS